MDNYAIADNFSLLAKLMDIHGENSFKTKTYAIAAFNIEKMPGPIERNTAAKNYSRSKASGTVWVKRSWKCSIPVN